MARFEPIGFETIKFENDYKSQVGIRIMRDTDTGVMYIFTDVGNAGGLTPLLGPDGKPQFYISSNEQ